MSIKFKTNDKRVKDNLADTKKDLRKNFYAIGTDGKKSYLTSIEKALPHQARMEAKSWAKKHGLTLEVVRSNQN